MYFSLFRNNFQVIFPHFVGLKSRSSLKKQRAPLCPPSDLPQLPNFCKSLYFLQMPLFFFENFPIFLA